MTLLLMALLAGAPDGNLLSVEAGAFAVTTPPSYGGAWSPQAMVDGDPATGWCSAADSKGPWVFVFELEQRSLLSGVQIQNGEAEEAGYPGISAAGLEVWVSSSGPAEGFSRVASVPLKRAGAGQVTLPKETFARWVKLVVPRNLGEKRYTELMEVSVTGQPLEPAPRRSFSASWSDESGGLFKLSDDGGALSGCRVGAGSVWLLRGTSRGRTGSLTWTDAASEATGKLAVVMTDDGSLHGPAPAGWTDFKRTEGTVDCRQAAEDLRFGKRLGASRLGVILGGVSFEPGDELRLEAGNELGALERFLAQGGRRARVMVLGRTTEAAPDELKRCERRAQRLLQALQKAGVPAGAVEIGFGLLKVGSAVQLEPRVEVVLLD